MGVPSVPLEYIYIYIYVHIYIYNICDICIYIYVNETLISLDQQAGGGNQKTLEQGGHEGPA